MIGSDQGSLIGSDQGSLIGDRRAVSVTVGYVLTLAIATALIGGLLIGAGSLLEAQTQQTIEGELDVAGQQVASGLMSADRLVRADADGDPETVVVTVELPDRVATSDYWISAENGALQLTVESHDLEVTVPFSTTLDVEADLVRGGNVRITYDGVDTLVVESS